MFVYDKANVHLKYTCPLVFREDGTKEPKFVENPWGNKLRPTNVRYEPAVYAVTPPGVTDITCIAMTRSLGDFYAHQFGLSYEPDISFVELDQSQTFTVCVASDGVWDCWKFNDFCDLCNEYLDAQDTVDVVMNKLLDESIRRAKQHFKNFDDASLVLMVCRGQ